ncbi:hypothetical protein EAI_10663 [Harpegnathos saltator]|uniref:Uncharacterized protein n=1 Tax=Harpegnathos saltator TaxID=610380 RepID=E2BHV6_HARSA|nr:hypothetical protein EAI_10663 [Harpegnathos saltator]
MDYDGKMRPSNTAELSIWLLQLWRMIYMASSKTMQFVYLKDHEKREWLLHLLDDNVRSSVMIKTMDIDYGDMPSLQKLNNTFRCNNHMKNCALQNVLNTFNWWSQRKLYSA